MIFNIAYLLFWLSLIIYPITFGDIWHEQAFIYGSLVQVTCLFFCILSYASKPTNRQKSCLILLGIYGIFSQLAGVIGGEVTALYLILESLTFFSWAIWLMLRQSISTAKTINHNNILLAFYKGEKGSFTMNFFELFGSPVKSMCILAGDEALYLKSNKKRFQFGGSAKILKNDSDYIIIDTGKRVTTDFIIEMKKHSNILATKGLFRLKCIWGVSDLLGMISDEFKPKSYVPSLYLRQIMK